MLKFNKLMLFVAATAILVSCKKKSDINPEPVPEPPITEKPATYSKLSTEEHKVKLEQAGLDFTKQMEELRDGKAASTINSLLSLPVRFYEKIDLFESVVVKSGAKQTNNAINAISNDAALKNTYTLKNAYGIYTYNPKTGDWDKEASADMLQVKFPATKNGSSNNAVLTMTYKKTANVYNSGDESYELPASVTAKLTVSESVVMDLTAEFTYDGSNNVTAQKTTMTAGNYVLKNSFMNTTKDAAIDFSFEKSGKALLKGNLKTNGKFTNKEIGDAADTYTEADLFNNANCKLQLMGIQLVGTADFTALRIADKAVSLTLPKEEIAKQKAANKNKFINMYAAYAEDNTIIAKSDFYVTSNTFDKYEYNPKTGYYEIVGKQTEYGRDVRLMFKDQTAINADVYFEKGFKNLMDELDAFTNKFN